MTNTHTIYLFETVDGRLKFGRSGRVEKRKYGVKPAGVDMRLVKTWYRPDDNVLVEGKIRDTFVHLRRSPNITEWIICDTDLVVSVIDDIVWSIDNANSSDKSRLATVKKNLRAVEKYPKPEPYRCPQDLLDQQKRRVLLPVVVQKEFVLGGFRWPVGIYEIKFKSQLPYDFDGLDNTTY